jgi:hypothetical protein
MNFGALQIATLWRLAKDGVIRQAVVVDGTQGPRLVIVEADQIVQWERFVMAGPLRKRAVELQKEHKKKGWAPADAPMPDVRKLKAEMRKFED